MGEIKKCCDRGDAALSDWRALVVPRAGVEPARVAPLVFETSASTDSAIWASKRVQRYDKNLK